MVRVSGGTLEWVEKDPEDPQQTHRWSMSIEGTEAMSWTETSKPGGLETGTIVQIGFSADWSTAEVFSWQFSNWYGSTLSSEKSTTEWRKVEG